MYPLFAKLARMQDIRRWGWMRSVHSENSCKHSGKTAVPAHAPVKDAGELLCGAYF
ncbi:MULTISPECIES: YfbR-like 5'-deoxynucleotidase [Caproicibacterium]|uniref:YfbR-like 5'-deoxynucleotidase n=1 Tax=Caproicibacterium argilliputei TaxID=3030016 RepID=A0AA97H225_9FIRM|nr:YfbR-like 5'-deoxynucleotidase [Caproicibacterium argilliputei]WOC32310.1 YfbR-like 5'-deoxynucleotidase [Caproicibacterium argilliputei]